jgi:hypothetical protein
LGEHSIYQEINMAITSAHNKVDVAPSAVRQKWTTTQDYEIWWEDPRDLFRVDVRFAPGTAPKTAEIHLQYWRQSWPEVHVPKGAVVGSGREGWLALDDWTNGKWQRADCETKLTEECWSATFRPLNLAEFPEQEDFPAEFRRTLKVQLHFDHPGAKIDEVEAFTDSEWREEDLTIEWKSVSGDPVTWDGHLEVFNGAPLSIQPLSSGVEMVDSASWRSLVEGTTTAGVRATVRYGYNEDANSYDRTIVTVRSEEHSFSFLVDDVLAGEPVYVRDLGVIVSRADAGVCLATFEPGWEKGHRKTLYQRVHELPEQTWEQAWADMPAKRRFYFVLGCDGGRQKFGVEPNGDIFLAENFIRRVPGKDTSRLGWEGKELRYGFGFPQVETGDRSILGGYLPVVRTMWTDGSLCYEQEAYATWLFGDVLTERMAGDDPVVAMVRVRVTNLGEGPGTAHLFLTAAVDQQTFEHLVGRKDLVLARKDSAERLRYLLDANGAGTLASRENGLSYDLWLPGQSSHTIFFKIPFIELTEAEELSRLRTLSYDEERERVVAFWQRRIAEGAQIETPNETLNNFYRTHLMHMLVVNDREPGSDRNVARCGGFHYGSFPDEGCMVISDLDRRGYTKEAERCLELYVHHQGTAPLPGNFQSADGVFYGSGGYEVAGYNRNQGWVLWCLAEHYRCTRDQAWLERVAPALVKGCDWIVRERQATMRSEKNGSRPIDYGFLPAGSLEDVTDYWTWLSVNAYAYFGFSAAAEVLAEIDHSEAARLRDEAEAYGWDLREGFFEACVRSPVVRLRDGTWVPHFPPRQQRRGRDFGWLREVLEGAAHLVYCGLIAPDEPAARWIIEDYEDNLFLSDQYGYSTADFERQWFSWGGFSMQPNLLIFPLLYLARDEPKHFLRSYFNPFAAAFYPDTLMLTEHPLPTLADWLGDHFKSSDEALSTYWLRLMFLAEYGDELFVGQAIPRAWFGDGRTMRVERALTHFGEVSLDVTSCAATGTIVVKLDPPRRNPPRRIRLRVRHPEGELIRSVWVNGRPHLEFDVEREEILFENWDGPVEVRVKY